MTATNSEKGHRKLKKNRLRLCDLPDEILIGILSLLPTKSAIATTVLSKRWRYLWTSVSNLSFYASYGERRSEFIDFVDTAMILHDRSCLVSYSLACHVLSDAPRINVWITSAVRSNIQHLSLHLSSIESPSSYMLPCCLFSCQSLVKLDLTMCNRILRVPSSVWLPNLKHLTLGFVRFVDDESTEKLLSHPSLEELHIEFSDWAQIVSVSVSAPKLQVLVIKEDSVYYEEDGDGNEDRNLVSDFSNGRKLRLLGSNLEYFRFTGCPINEYSICGSMQLKKAELLVHYASPSKVDIDVVAKRCYKLLSCLSWVQDLTLTEDFLEHLEQIPELVDTIPVFEYLTCLNLVGPEEVCIDRVMLMKIYERCPNLEHLNIKQVVSGLVSAPILDPIPSCFRTHLKMITVTNYLRGDQDNAIDVLLNSALVLEEMIVCYREHDCYDEDEIKELEDELNQRPRVSRDCRISVVLGSEFDDF